MQEGQEELLHVQGQGGVTSSKAMNSGYALLKELWLRGRRRAKGSYSTFKDRRGGHEEIPLVQGKRNPSKMVGAARGHQRADTLKPSSQKTSQSDHKDRSLA